MRLATAIAAALGAVMLAAPACASGFDYTHRLKITVEYRYDWTFSTTERCGRSGSGSYHAKASTKSVRVRLVDARRAGRFLMLIPYGPRGARDLPPQHLLGNYELANNAPYVGDCPPDINVNDENRSDCGSKSLPKKADVGGSTSADRPNKISARIRLSTRTGSCEQLGALDLDDVFPSPTRKPFLVGAPSARKLRKSSVTVSASETINPDLGGVDLSGSAGVGSGTATRTVRYEFTRL